MFVEDTNECSIYQFLCENGRCIDTNTGEGFLCECGVGYVYNAISKRCEGTIKTTFMPNLSSKVNK